MKDWKKKICLGTVCLLSAPLTLAKKVLCACVPDLHINLTSRRYYEILIIVHLKESGPELHPNFSHVEQRILCLAVLQTSSAANLTG